MGIAATVKRKLLGDTDNLWYGQGTYLLGEMMSNVDRRVRLEF